MNCVHPCCHTTETQAADPQALQLQRHGLPSEALLAASLFPIPALDTNGVFALENWQGIG